MDLATPTAPPPASFTSLPPELLRHILLVLVFTSHGKPDGEAAEGRRTLAACCLVAKRVRAEAAPLLWRDVVLLSESHVRSMAASAREGELPEAKEHARSLRVENIRTRILGDVFAILEGLPGLRDLFLDDGGGQVDLSVLNRFHPHLQNFRLKSATLSTLPPAFTLSSLQHLSLQAVRSLPQLATLFTSLSLPSLRTLAFVLPGVDPAERATLANSLVHGGLLAQLQVLQLHSDDYTMLTSQLYNGSAAVLVSLEWSAYANEFWDNLPTIVASRPPYLRIFTPFRSLDEYEELLTDSDGPDPLAFLSTVATRDEPPKAFLLPSYLEPSTPLHSPSAALSLFFSICRSRGIDVVSYDEGEEEEFTLSPAFRRYVEGKAACK